MIRLIASDIDGTLIPYGQTELPEELFPLILRLREKGVLFCPASGRQLHSLRRLFGPVAEEICCLCENGAAVFGPGPETQAPILYRSVIPRAESMELIGDMLAAERCVPMASGINTSYLCRRDQTLFDHMKNDIGNNVTFVDRAEDISEEIVKISAWCPRGTLEGVEAFLAPRWTGRINFAVAGAEWLDFTGADKGVGIRALCAALGVDPADTVAVGDNWNDLPMLRAVGEPRLMETAPEELRAMFPRQCRSVPELLRGLLSEL